VRSQKYKYLTSISDRRSIEDIPAREIIKKAFPDGRPQLFGVIGGPPCPDFSNGGKHRGHQGDHGRLSKIYVDRICELKPHFFVFENVPGLIRTKKHRRFLSKLEYQLEISGYCIDIAVLNALDLGHPQDRARVILIGMQRELIESIVDRKVQTKERGWFTWPIKDKYHNAKYRFNWPSIVPRRATPELPDDIPIELTVSPLLNGDNPPWKLPNGNEGFRPYSKKFKIVCEGDTSRKSFKRLHRYRYSPTACYGNNEVHLHPWEDRRLTVRESMRIQGIPDLYALPEYVPLTPKFKIISNGVPVPLAYHVASKLYDFLKPAF
jgi:DNA (cytosine-5)-methyltransferase 1